MAPVVSANIIRAKGSKFGSAINPLTDQILSWCHFMEKSCQPMAKSLLVQRASHYTAMDPKCKSIQTEMLWMVLIYWMCSSPSAPVAVTDYLFIWHTTQLWAYVNSIMDRVVHSVTTKKMQNDKFSNDVIKRNFNYCDIYLFTTSDRWRRDIDIYLFTPHWCQIWRRSVASLVSVWCYIYWQEVTETQETRKVI